MGKSEWQLGKDIGCVSNGRVAKIMLSWWWGEKGGGGGEDGGVWEKWGGGVCRGGEGGVGDDVCGGEGGGGWWVMVCGRRGVVVGDGVCVCGVGGGMEDARESKR